MTEPHRRVTEFVQEQVLDVVAEHADRRSLAAGRDDEGLREVEDDVAGDRIREEEVVARRPVPDRGDPRKAGKGDGIEGADANVGRRCGGRAHLKTGICVRTDEGDPGNCVPRRERALQRRVERARAVDAVDLVAELGDVGGANDFRCQRKARVHRGAVGHEAPGHGGRVGVKRVVPLRAPTAAAELHPVGVCRRGAGDEKRDPDGARDQTERPSVEREHESLRGCFAVRCACGV